MFSKNKLIKAGNFLHMYEYDTPVEYDFTKHEQLPTTKKEGDKETTGSTNTYRIKKNIRLLLQANTLDESNLPLFVTLTFADNIQNSKEANRLFSKFIQRLNYQVYGKKTSQIKYLAVIEYQTRGAVHYHVVFFNMGKAKDAYDVVKHCWQYGFSTIQDIKSLKDLTNYVYKDLVKARQKKWRKGQRFYFPSRNLEKPETYRTTEKIQKMLSEANYEPQFIKYYRSDNRKTKYMLLKKSG